MTFSIIIAGGSGQRMGQDIPKQFIHIQNKPVLIYTLESFQYHEEIDQIGVVCIRGWEGMLQAYARQFNISKLVWVIEGGETVQESIFQGVKKAGEYCELDDIVVIHDGIRPLVDNSVLSDVIHVCKEHGNAVSSMPYNEQIFRIDPDQPDSTISYVPRETLRRVATPQAYKYDLLSKAYEKAFRERKGIHGTSYTNTMMTDLGVRLYFAAGSDRNIKLTTKDDLEIFEACLRLQEPDWLK